MLMLRPRILGSMISNVIFGRLVLQPRHVYRTFKNCLSPAAGSRPGLCHAGGSAPKKAAVAKASAERASPLKESPSAAGRAAVAPLETASLAPEDMPITSNAESITASASVEQSIPGLGPTADAIPQSKPAKAEPEIDSAPQAGPATKAEPADHKPLIDTVMDIALDEAAGRLSPTDVPVVKPEQTDTQAQGKSPEEQQQQQPAEHQQSQRKSQPKQKQSSLSAAFKKAPSRAGSLAVGDLKARKGAAKSGPAGKATNAAAVQSKEGPRQPPSRPASAGSKRPANGLPLGLKPAKQQHGQPSGPSSAPAATSTASNAPALAVAMAAAAAPGDLSAGPLPKLEAPSLAASPGTAPKQEALSEGSLGAPSISTANEEQQGAPASAQSDSPPSDAAGPATDNPLQGPASGVHNPANSTGPALLLQLEQPHVPGQAHSTLPPSVNLNPTSGVTSSALLAAVSSPPQPRSVSIGAPMTIEMSRAGIMPGTSPVEAGILPQMEHSPKSGTPKDADGTSPQGNAATDRMRGGDEPATVLQENGHSMGRSQTSSNQASTSATSLPEHTVAHHKICRLLNEQQAGRACAHACQQLPDHGWPLLAVTCL